MKSVFFLIAAILVAFLCCGSAAAVSEAEILDLDALESAQPEAAQDAYGTLKADEITDLQGLLRQLWSYLSCQSDTLISSALCNGAQILLISYLAVLCCALSESKAISFLGAVTVALVCVKSVFSGAAIGRQALKYLTDYSHVLLPCLSTAAAIGGAWTSAGSKYAAAALAMDVMITLEQNIMVPILYTYLSTAITAQLTEQPILLSVTGIIKHLLKWGLILLTSCFTLYLSVTGILSGTVDAAAAKAAKTVISGALPVVGGIISDASGALLSGAQMLRNGIGLVGMLVILAVCVSPYLALGGHYLVYQIISGVTASFGNKQIGNVIRSVGDAYGFLLGMVGSVSLMLFVSVISLMKTVSSA